MRNENLHLTQLAALQEKRLVKSLGRLDIIMFIIAAYISLDTIGTIAAMGLGASWMMATDRIQAMAAADGAFMNGWFGEFSERFGTPMRVNMLSGVMASLFLVAGMKLVSGDTGAIFKVVLSCAVSTLLVSYLLIIPAVMKLNRNYPEVNRPFVTPGGRRGFQIMGTIVFIYIVLGSMGVLFPGTVEGLLGIKYSFADTWPLKCEGIWWSRKRFNARL